MMPLSTEDRMILTTVIVCLVAGCTMMAYAYVNLFIILSNS